MNDSSGPCGGRAVRAPAPRERPAGHGARCAAPTPSTTWSGSRAPARRRCRGSSRTSTITCARWPTAASARSWSCPIGFVSDHVEVLWDLDTEARDTAAELGPRVRPRRDAGHASRVRGDGARPRPRAAVRRRAAVARRARAVRHRLPGRLLPGARPQAGVTLPGRAGDRSCPAGDVTVGVVRIGDTVRRPRQETSAAVAEYLAWLADHGFDRAPRYLGVDAQGRDVLTYPAPATCPATRSSRGRRPTRCCRRSAG